MSAVLANADDSTYFGDIDLGEMFLNYYLDQALRPYAGVDILQLKILKGSVSEGKVMRWERSNLLSEDIIKGNRVDAENPF
jgi:hypothetical protein